MARLVVVLSPGDRANSLIGQIFHAMESAQVVLQRYKIEPPLPP
jgi:hypothetical protein